MNNYKLTKINSDKFFDFLNSNKDEIEYFDTKSESGLVSLEEYYSEYVSKLEQFDKEVAPIIKLMSAKDSSVDTIKISNNGKIYIGNKHNLFDGTAVKCGRGNKFKLAYRYDTISTLYDNITEYIEDRKRFQELNETCHGELVEIESIRQDVFSDSYEKKPTASNIFLARCLFDNRGLEVNNGKRNVSLISCHDNIDSDFYYGVVSGRFYDVPYDYGDCSSKMLNSDDCKKLIKKLYIKK